MTKDQELFKKLDTVIDPELQLPITDMGLIYGIEQKNNTVKVTMTLTTIGCPLYDVIHDDIVTALKKDPTIIDVEVELTFDPPWNPDMMTDAAKMEIGFL